ncbi:hypothetical protein P3S67_008359 [Capsicum chacoense]
MQSSQAKYISLLSIPIQKSTDFPSRYVAVNHCDPIFPQTPCMTKALMHQTALSWTPRMVNLVPQNAVLSHSHLHLQKFKIVSFWKKKRASGSVRTIRLMLQSAYYIASKLKILPEPLDVVLREFGGGNGGGGGGFGFGSGGFDGWGKRGRRKIGNWGFGVVFFVILGVGFWLVLGKRLELDVFLGVLGLTLFGISVNVWKKGVLDWALGFCCCAALVGLFLKEDLVRCFGTFKIVRRRRKRRLF